MIPKSLTILMKLMKVSFHPEFHQHLGQGQGLQGRSDLSHLQQPRPQEGLKDQDLPGPDQDLPLDQPQLQGLFYLKKMKSLRLHLSTKFLQR